MLTRYAGVTQYEELPPAGDLTGVAVRQQHHQKGAASKGQKASGASGSPLLPYAVACSAMQSFLSCKGCTSVAAVIAGSNKDFSNEYYEATRTNDFAEVSHSATL